MALIFADSFDHYSTTDLQNNVKWDFQSATGSNSINSTTGQNSTNSWRIASNNIYLEKNITETATLVFGFWFKFSTQTTTQQQLLGLFNLTTQQFGLWYENGRIAMVNSTSTRIGQANYNLRPNVENYIECKVTIGDGSGMCEVRVNGNVVFNRSSIRTGTALINRVRLGGTLSSMGNVDYDDFYLLDTTGSNNNDFLGPIHIESIRPNAAGTDSEWSVLTGPSNYQDVDETTPDGDTSYVFTDVVGERDSYNFPSLGISTGTIKNVVINQSAKKTGVGTRTINVAVQSTGSYTSGTALSVPGAAYRYLRFTIPQDPNTSAEWTVSDFNAAEFGPHLAS